MKKIPLSIENKKGLALQATLELPVDRKPLHYAVFAHCFTCSSDLSAVRHVSRALTSSGFGVLRFDFTGLGKSEGEFAESNFSANVEDLISVSDYMEQHYEAPGLLVGHSLGGAAVLVAAGMLSSVKAVATIGAPSDVRHVKHLFEDQLPSKEFEGKTRVNIGGRPFEIDSGFVLELEKVNLLQTVEELRKPLLIMHSPIDRIVGVEHAKRIYQAALHPKSFVSLNQADHLLAKRKDAAYAGTIIGAWVGAYFDNEKPEALSTQGEQVAGVLDLVEDNFTTHIATRKHSLKADEPEEIGGDDLGFAPYELLNSALIACTAMTLKLYAERKGWPLEQVTVYTSHSKKHSDELKLETDQQGRIDHILKRLKIEGDLSPEQREKLKEIASKCPVHRTLLSEVVIDTELVS